MEKLRVYSGSVSTMYGVEHGAIYDDPVSPAYISEAVAILKLMSKLDYVEAENGDSEYPGYWANDVCAKFEYEGYVDIDIPDTIVKRIRDSSAHEDCEAEGTSLRRCPHCGNRNFIGHQLIRADVLVDIDSGDFSDNLIGGLDNHIYDAEKPYGPFTCSKCGYKVDELELLDESREEAK